MNSSWIKIFLKDIQIKQCFEDPKACLKLAADDKGYVSFTWTHFPFLPNRGLYPDNDKNPPHTALCSVCITWHHYGVTAFGFLQRAIQTGYIEGLRQFKVLISTNVMSPLSIITLHCFILLSYPCQCEYCHPCYWAFWQDFVFLSIRILKSVPYLVLCQVNRFSTLQLSVVSSSDQLFLLLKGLSVAVLSLMWLCLSGCSCCRCCFALSGCPVGLPVGVLIWQAGPVPPADTRGVNRSTKTCGVIPKLNSVRTDSFT